MQTPNATAHPPPAGAPSVAGLSPLSVGARRLLALSVVLLVAACSSIKLGYNNADTLLMYSLDSYFDLDDSQEKLARERVRELLAWHRSTQLTQYARFVDEAQGRLGGSGGQVTADDVLAFQAAMNQKLVRVGEQAAPEMARLALTLQPAQIDRFADKLAKDQSKARRELLRFAGRESLDERVKRYTDRAETWFGSVNPQQLELVRSTLASRPATETWWMDERERRQREAVALLRRIQAEQPAPEVAAGWIRGYFAELQLSSDPERRARSTEFRQRNAQLIAQLINAATPQQRTALAKKLRGYAEDFTTLASANGRG